jgi:hypothetical protein
MAVIHKEWKWLLKLAALRRSIAGPWVWREAIITLTRKGQTLPARPDEKLINGASEKQKQKKKGTLESKWKDVGVNAYQLSARTRKMVASLVVVLVFILGKGFRSHPENIPAAAILFCCLYSSICPFIFIQAIRKAATSSCFSPSSLRCWRPSVLQNMPIMAPLTKIIERVFIGLMVLMSVAFLVAPFLKVSDVVPCRISKRNWHGLLLLATLALI